MTTRRSRPHLRVLFDELLPFRSARALRELGFRVSYVGNSEDDQPKRGSSDERILAHAAGTNQIVATYNHDMIMLCNERQQTVLWIDPRGKQFRADELAALCLLGLAKWEALLASASGAVCLRVLRTKVEVLPLARAAQLAERRMRGTTTRKRRKTRGSRKAGPGQTAI